LPRSPTSDFFPYTTLFRSTELDEQFNSEITLSLPSAEEQLVTDVVFVLDKSTSTDVEEEAVAMLESLKDQVMETGAKQRPHLSRSEEHTSELQSRFDLVCR